MDYIELKRKPSASCHNLVIIDDTSREATKTNKWTKTTQFPFSKPFKLYIPEH